MDSPRPTSQAESYLRTLRNQQEQPTENTAVFAIFRNPEQIGRKL